MRSDFALRATANKSRRLARRRVGADAVESLPLVGRVGRAKRRPGWGDGAKCGDSEPPTRPCFALRAAQGHPPHEGEGLRERIAPLYISKLSNSPRLRSTSFAGHARTKVQSRVIAPRFVRPQGSPVFSLAPSSFPRRGVRNDRAFHRARGAMWVSTWQPYAEAHGENKPRTQRIRLRSARDGFIGLQLPAAPRARRLD
jgi:hypothetical protein